MDTCPKCHGTGAIDAPTSADDPTCPRCDGEGVVESEHHIAVITGTGNAAQRRELDALCKALRGIE
jgi:DnaJ-class molecular chaperone